MYSTIWVGWPPRSGRHPEAVSRRQRWCAYCVAISAASGSLKPRPRSRGIKDRDACRLGLFGYRLAFLPEHGDVLSHGLDHQRLSLPSQASQGVPGCARRVFRGGPWRIVNCITSSHAGALVFR